MLALSHSKTEEKDMLKFYFRFHFVLVLLMNTTLSYACFDVTKLIEIGQELANTYQQTLCETPLTSEKVHWIIENSLPKMMNESFLSVPPPPQWQPILSSLLNQCQWQGSLCTEKAQREFAICSQTQLPLIMMAFSPWLSDNCTQLNEHLITHWAERKIELTTIIKQMIAAS